MVKASLIEGKGPFSCTDGSHTEFKTNNLEEFNKHLSTHSYYGETPCPICDKPVRNLSMDKLVPNGKRPRCDECKKEGY